MYDFLSTPLSPSQTPNSAIDAQRRALVELMGAVLSLILFISRLISPFFKQFDRSIDSFAAIIDQNLTEEEKKSFTEIRWDDEKVCGPFMVRFCPHDLFLYTKMDLGNP